MAAHTLNLRNPESRGRAWDLKLLNKSKQVLEVHQTVLSGRGQAIADRILAESLAECVAKCPAFSQPRVNTNRNMKSNHVGAKALSWQNSSSQRLLDSLVRTDKMHQAGTNRQVRSEPAI